MADADPIGQRLGSKTGFEEWTGCTAGPKVACLQGFFGSEPSPAMTVRSTSSGKIQLLGALSVASDRLVHCRALESGAWLRLALALATVVS